ncbi:MAG: hypothetical protein VKN33_08680 [Candidatus Sericytochromatia bacterium]|nr:hypothetical protein [Candidatus Sericytochromatia bacterium]
MHTTGPLFSLFLILALASCAAPNFLVEKAPKGFCQASGTIAFTEAAPQYRLRQAPEALRPFARIYLERIELFLRRLDQAQPVDVLIGIVLPAAFDQPLLIDGLSPERPYRVIAKAYQPWDAAKDSPLVEAQISASSITDFSAGPADSITRLDANGGIRVVLADRDFIASTTGNFDILYGSFDSTSASEVLGIRGGP